MRIVLATPLSCLQVVGNAGRRWYAQFGCCVMPVNDNISKTHITILPYEPLSPIPIANDRDPPEVGIRFVRVQLHAAPYPLPRMIRADAACHFRANALIDAAEWRHRQMQRQN